MIVIFNVACEEEIDFPVPEGGAQRLVVDGIITNEVKAHQVKLTYTSQFNSSVIPTVNDAVVYISDGTIRHFLQGRGNGIYETDSLVKGEVGKTYTLEISLQNGDDYRAQSTMQKIGSIDSLRVEVTTQTVDDDGDQEYYSIFAEAKVLSEDFMLETIINGQRYGTIKNVGYGSSKFVTNGQFIDALFGLVETNDQNFVEGNNNVSIRMSSIDENYKEFLIGFSAQLFRGDDGLGGLFDGPAANVPSNVNNGALGSFGAFAVTEREIVITK